MIKRMTLEDVESVYAIEAMCYKTPWSENSFCEELKNPAAFYYVYEVDGEVAGYAGFWQIIDEAHIMNIAVHPKMQGKGIGQKLLDKMIKACEKMEFVLISLEVRKSNDAARALYNKNGFKIDGERKGYYADDNEDAILMTRRIVEC